MTKSCIVCGATKPIEMHHVLPCEHGGPMDGLMVPLCRNHHAEVHSLQRSVAKGKLAISNISNPTMRTLVQKANEQYVVFAQTGVAEDARRRVVLHCSQEELDMVHLLRDDGGFNSIETLLRTIIRERYNRVISGKI